MNFEAELRQLNKHQREAVEAIEGPVMVIAGPGTGKTQILTLRIANILQKTDTPPESILALTFTESAVASMKQRLLDIIGAPAYQVSIKTIHGFCNEVITEHPEAFPEIAGGSNVSEVEQIQIIRQLLDSGKYDLLRSFGDPYRSVRDIMVAISNLKREGRSPADFAKIVKIEQRDFDDTSDMYHEKGVHKGKMKGKYQTQQKRIERHEELVGLYEAYQKVLAKSRRYDYDDMILSVAQVLRKDKDLRFILQEKYLYILVDEHQDTNQSQNEVIELLASFHENPNLFVVGDAKQAIYRFQGASLENFAYFKKRFTGAKVIALTDNYRSTQTILDAALDIAGKEPLTANAPHPKKHIAIAACETTEIEPYVIARHIQERIEKGAKPEEVAVLYRNNKDSAPIARYLEKLGVPFSISADDDAFDDVGVKKLLLLLEAVRDFGKDYAFIPALYLDISHVVPLDVALLIDAAREQKSSVFSLVRDRKILERIIPGSSEAVFALYSKMSLWKAMSKSFSLMPMFEAMVRELNTTELVKVYALFDELKELIVKHRNLSLEDFLEHLQIMREHRVRIKSHVSNDALQGVRLMTAHKSKGMEFEYVYLTGATNAHWEGKRDRDLIKLPESVYSRHSDILKNVRITEDNDSDERNLFYVALTRAKRELVISYGKKNKDGTEQLPSAFITAIRPELVKELSVLKIEKKFIDHPEIEFSEYRKTKTASTEAEFLRKRFLEKGLSVSAINNYLDCPTKFYFLNLVGMREAPNPSAQAGNAAHGALKYAVQSLSSKKDFLNRFKYLLSKEPMREIDYREAIKKGEKALSAYFDVYHKTWSSDMKAEYPIDGVKVGEIPVRGRLDRIDMLDGGRVRVIDYKFKKPAKDSNYVRQLTFYKLLIEEGTTWKMADAILEFLESAPNGKYKPQVFAPSDAEVADLKKEIIRVTKEILQMKFKGCGEKECKYCALQELSSPAGPKVL